MLDEETTRLSADAISTVIAALFEHGAARAAFAPHATSDYSDTAADLKAIATDVAVLADSLAVIARRAQSGTALSPR